MKFSSSVLAMVFLLSGFSFIPVSAWAVASKSTENKVELNIQGMHCISCAKSLEKALKHLKGVKFAKVNIKENKAVVTYLEGSVSQKDLISAIEAEGYEGSVIN